MEDLLTDLSWNFNIIALSETWNDEKTKANFTAPLIDGYHKYTGATGSSLKGGCGLYVSENLSPIPRSDLEFKIEDKNSETESHWIELTSESGPNTIIGGSKDPIWIDKSFSDGTHCQTRYCSWVGPLQ